MQTWQLGLRTTSLTAIVHCLLVLTNRMDGEVK